MMEQISLGGGGGTCCTAQAASIFSGIWARVLSAVGTGTGPASPIIYELPATDFHDIAADTHNFNDEYSGPGYDFATGRGSMIIAQTITDVAALTPPPPTVNFKITQSGPLTLHFKDESTDSDATIVNHHWDFGDGKTSTGTNPTHTYAASGTYTVVETVTDTKNATGQDSQTASTSDQIMVNPSFETGSFTPWKLTKVANGGTVVLDSTAADAFDGSWSADLTFGGGTWLYQTVTIPSWANTATLVVHLHIVDNEPPVNTNGLNIQLRQPGGGAIGKDTVLTTLGSFTNLQASSGYVTETYDVSSYKGQQVIVTFQGIKESNKTPVSGEFAIDDVTLTAQ